MDFEIARRSGFLIEHCYACAVPGYLIVTPLDGARSLDALPHATTARLGPVLADVSAMVTAIVAPLRVYCAQFGEEDARIHFHVFPRSRALTDAYLAAFPEHASRIHGPVLLDWARERYRCAPEETFAAVSGVIERMRRWWGERAGPSSERGRAARSRTA